MVHCECSYNPSSSFSLSLLSLAVDFSCKMGGDMLNDWELTPSRKGFSTVVMVGKAGNGKSATGNSILGRKAFVSALRSRGVTTTCELQSTIAADKRIVNVIDTPGLFDFSMDCEVIGKEIVNCIRLAKDGIHAVLMVFSLSSRFTTEEDNVIKSMESIFGERIVDYLIIIFTGGDSLEHSGETLDVYLSDGAEPLKEILRLCKNRVMLFDNRTQDKAKQARQVKQLLYLVDLVVTDNDGKPFSDENFDELKKGALRMQDQVKEVETTEGYSEHQILELKEQIHTSYEDRLNRVTEMILRKLNKVVDRLEKQLAEEQAARMKSEEEINKLKLEAKMKSEKEISRLEEQWEAKMKSEKEISNKLKEQLEAKTKSEEETNNKLRMAEESQKFREDAENNKKKSSCTIL